MFLTGGHTHSSYLGSPSLHPSLLRHSLTPVRAREPTCRPWVLRWYCEITYFRHFASWVHAGGIKSPRTFNYTGHSRSPMSNLLIKSPTMPAVSSPRISKSSSALASHCQTSISTPPHSPYPTKPKASPTTNREAQIPPTQLLCTSYRRNQASL
jgi:hypothetical protein